MTTDTISQPEASVQTPVPVNYWGTDERHTYKLPDGVQYFEFKIMNEGDKVKFQKLTNQDLTVGRDNTAKIKVDPASERHTLIETSVTGWKLFMPKDFNNPSMGMEEVTFSSANLKNWLQMAPPKVVEDLEHAIRMANPWMQAEMTTVEVDKEIERLYEVRKQVVEREAGEGSSKSK